MFTNLESLEPEKHAALCFAPATNLAFAASVASAPLSATEMALAARHFPIVFPDAEPLMPVALMSLKAGENAFIDGDGAWSGGYVPAHLRRYPFILGNTDEPERFSIMVAADAPQLGTDSGERLYEDSGEMAPALEKAVEFLKAFQQETVATQQLVAPLAEKDVLTVQNVTVTHADGTSAAFEGLRAVDAEKVAALDDATLATWVRSGLMGLIYAHLNSIDNIKVLAERQGFITTPLPGDLNDALASVVADHEPVKAPGA